MKKDDNPKSNEESWAVEPPKKGGNKKRKALRVALIAAALGAVALAGVVLVVGSSIREQFLMPTGGAIIGNPREEFFVDRGIESAEGYDAAEKSAGVHNAAE